ncbi:hypothetical protein ASG29_04260 [Sphingomonas sp. Leaf412]|uniref:phosphotransferase family protein n=1 Tax=Sphingomonas sp. Leaf412 TaxID=1736370 RepID=UPI0006F4048E|nr:phosphotransferase family protein [Sphingomonas sp. Leaf412]KQT35317.1 hypothetical protein ASG29_04260 [Sphingomonas sp. Leaf412]
MTDTLDRIGDVWEGHAVDVAALDRYCRAHLDGFAGPLTVAQFHGGASNPTFLLTDTATTTRYVLRKQPPGALLSSAHAVDREYRVMRALGPTDVPVPAMLAWCGEAGVIGTPFYIMPFVAGRIYKDNHLADMTPPDRRAAYRQFAQVLARIHAVDPAAVGLADFGRAGGFYTRQVARWTRQYRAAATEVIPAMDRLIDRLPARIPATGRSTIVHGDYRQENLMFAPAAPHIVAVLDWELSTIGDPLSDLAFFCLFHHAHFTTWGSAATIDYDATGIPREAEFVADYCAAAGLDAIDDWAFHLGFAAFRLASIAQGVHKRVQTGAARDREGANSARDWADLAVRLLDG